MQTSESARALTTTTCRLAVSEPDRNDVYRLRYECYHRRGAIPADPSERFSDAFDQQPNHFSFLVAASEAGSSAEEPLGTVRISVVRPDLNWTTSPGAKVFGDHPTFQAIAAESYVEASRLCFRPQARRDVLYQLVANLVALADFYEATWLVACPRVEHSQIYQRMFGFRPLAAPRQYFGVNFETELLGIRLEEIRTVASGVRSMAKAWSQAKALVATSAVVATGMQ